MSALFNAFSAKIAVSICSFLVAAAGSPDDGAGRCILRLTSPIRITASVRGGESTDTTGTRSTDRADTTEAAAAEATGGGAGREKKKSVRISICDEGVRVWSGDGEGKVLLELDPAELGRVLGGDPDFDILGDLPDSLQVEVFGDEDSGYIEVRGTDVVRFGKDIHIGRRELVQGDVVAIAGNIVIEGKVRGDVVNILGNTELRGTAVVNGDVVTVLGELREYDNPRVRGETVNIAGGSPDIRFPFLSYTTGHVWSVAGKIAKLVILALLLLLVVYLLPDRMRISSDHVFGSFLKSLGVGILVLFVGSAAVLVVGLVLAITIIGIPVALLLMLAYGAFLILGFFASALALGRLACRRFGPAGEPVFLCGFIGLLLIALPGLMAAMMWVIPFTTPLQLLLKMTAVFVNFMAVVLGTGALIVSRGGTIAPVSRGPVEMPAVPAGPETDSAAGGYDEPSGRGDPEGE